MTSRLPVANVARTLDPKTVAKTVFVPTDHLNRTATRVMRI
jgi:hypothetical protein